MLNNPEIILGPPGTGKTTTLLNLVEAELKRGLDPTQIGYVSFTRKAAHEAASRAAERFDKKPEEFMWFRTLHSLAFRAMGLKRGDIFEGPAVDEFGKTMGIRMTGRYSVEEGATFGFERGDRILFMENLSRVRQIPLRQQYDEESDEQSWWEVDRIARGLALFKEEKHLVDYTDMLAMFVEQSWTPPLKVLFVDEAQDLSILQWKVVEKLAENCDRVFIAGDDDQAIYKWAGAAVDYFVDMPGRVRVLNQSWRTPKKVQALSGRILRTIHHRREKVWAPRDEEGIVHESTLEAVDWSDPDILVLSRNVLYLNAVRDRIRSGGYMYEYKGASSIKDSLRNAIVSYDRLTRKGIPQRLEDVKKIYEHMSTNVGVKHGHKQLSGFDPDKLVTMEDLIERGGLMRTDIWHDAFDRLPARDREYIRSCLRKREILSQKARIRLSTIHGAKGGEADHVVLLSDMAPRTWREMEKLPDDEARVWYVAVTRAKRRLTIIRPQSNHGFTFPPF